MDLSCSETNSTLSIVDLSFIVNGAVTSAGGHSYLIFPTTHPLQFSPHAQQSTHLRLHIHPTSGHPVGYPEIHLVYRDGKSSFNFEIDEAITSTVWHSDVSYERQPPGLTTFFLLAQPTTGGDTLFTSQVRTLKKLSPSFVGWLKTLKAVHSGHEQAQYSKNGKRGGTVRREPVENIHPVVRRHPVTGEDALYVNKQFTTKIVGLKREESGMCRFLTFNKLLIVVWNCRNNLKIPLRSYR